MRFAAGKTLESIRSAIDWQTNGQPVDLTLLQRTNPEILLSYRTGGTVNVCRVDSGAASVRTLSAEVPFPPLTLAGQTDGDSASIAVAYRARPDSTVGISYFTTIRGEANSSNATIQ